MGERRWPARMALLVSWESFLSRGTLAADPGHTELLTGTADDLAPMSFQQDDGSRNCPRRRAYKCPSRPSSNSGFGSWPQERAQSERQLKTLRSSKHSILCRLNVR